MIKLYDDLPYDDFLGLTPIKNDEVVQTVGTCGLMYYTQGVMKAIQPYKLGLVIDSTAAFQLSIDEVKNITVDSTDIKFVFPPDSPSTNKFTLMFDPENFSTKVLSICTPETQTQITAFATTQLPTYGDSFIKDRFITKIDKGNCIVAQNTKGGFDINYAGEPIKPLVEDILEIITPPDTANTAILFHAYDEEAKTLTNSFNTDLFFKMTGDALYNTQDFPNSDIHIDHGSSEGWGKIIYKLKVPNFAWNDTADFKVIKNIISGTTYYQGVPNWDIPVNRAKEYTDNQIGSLRHDISDYDAETIAPALAKITELEGLVTQLRTDLTTLLTNLPQEFQAIVDTTTSNVTVTVTPGKKLSINAPTVTPRLRFFDKK